ncbi:FAD-dependent monooxygenase [Actinomadura rayongensis]|uniref:FAD-dependent oxidoreductase n=1 Tax=Actinomadura rayongensis TaxID=1429076 RepID=A0A6I4WEV7_9ACTN|nr:FAD-dependent monooxygenase [Actinomadura rayongensis]MXQ68358.1 FAD-dependent oxidoreductase [Actinomadura rayongensis]
MPENVVIVGAGPTGLLLAGDLAAAGVDVTVLERRVGPSELTRAFAVHARTLELFDMRGIADDLVRTGRRVGQIRFFGHVGIDLSHLPGRFPFVLITPQYETDRVLRDRAVAAGARLQEGVEVTGLRQDAEGVAVHVRTADGTTGVHRAAYAVGADGAHSTVRAALGLPFGGTSAARSVMLADVRLRDEPQEIFHFGVARNVFAVIVPFGDGWYRAVAWSAEDKAAGTDDVDLDELRKALRAAHGTDFGLAEARWTSRYSTDERQVPRYRVGRVLLAGDAAHVHSPVGGQGMNIGLHDAANLAWRLAAVVRGHAPDTLLDGYHAERHPIGRQVVAGTGALMRMLLARSPAMRAARPLIVRAAALPPVRRRAALVASGLATAYPAPRGTHPLTGRRAPDVPLARGAGRLFEALRDGTFVLVAAADDPALGYLVEQRWAGRVRYAVAGGRTRATVLVRPDGHIAWATSETSPDARAAEVRDALAAWAGPAAAPAGQNRWSSRP